jgi:hypothetical protein
MLIFSKKKFENGADLKKLCRRSSYADKRREKGGGRCFPLPSFFQPAHAPTLSLPLPPLSKKRALYFFCLLPNVHMGTHSQWRCGSLEKKERGFDYQRGLIFPPSLFRYNCQADHPAGPADTSTYA